MQRHSHGVVGYLTMTLLQISRSVPVRKKLKSVRIWRRYGQQLVGNLFMAHGE